MPDSSFLGLHPRPRSLSPASACKDACSGRKDAAGDALRLSGSTEASPPPAFPFLQPLQCHAVQRVHQPLPIRPARW
eukprot:scaffold1277_cov253-Pinguiococcus_pyrenoidosus.AAC.42